MAKAVGCPHLTPALTPHTASASLPPLSAAQRTHSIRHDMRCVGFDQTRCDRWHQVCAHSARQHNTLKHIPNQAACVLHSRPQPLNTMPPYASIIVHAGSQGAGRIVAHQESIMLMGNWVGVKQASAAASVSESCHMHAPSWFMRPPGVAVPAAATPAEGCERAAPAQQPQHSSIGTPWPHQFSSLQLQDGPGLCCGGGRKVSFCYCPLAPPFQRQLVCLAKSAWILSK